MVQFSGLARDKQPAHSFSEFFEEKLFASRTERYLQRYFGRHPMPPAVEYFNSLERMQHIPLVGLLNTEELAVYRCMEDIYGSKATYTSKVVKDEW